MQRLIFAAMMLLLGLAAATAQIYDTPSDTLADRRVIISLNERAPLVPAEDVIVPPALQKGDLVAIVTPAGEAHGYDFNRIARVIEAQGFRTMIAPHAAARNGYYGGTADQRGSDLEAALLNPEVKAIICSRGGYGAVHLLDRLDRLPLRDNAKWLVGFSDISALHALMNRHGIASIHGPMGVNMKSESNPTPSVQTLFDILKGQHPTYTIDAHRLNREGYTIGTLVGGNLAVTDGLVGTPYNVIRPGTVLFIEDVAEPVYKVERMLYRLKLNGVLGQLAGLIVGDFTEAGPDDNYRSMEAMIREMVKDYDYPVAFGVPAGHARVNVPLMFGCPVLLDVSEEGTTITQ